MKKRLLALALCLVMMTSLLPVTALADPIYFFTGLQNGGTYCGDTYFQYVGPKDYRAEVDYNYGDPKGHPLEPDNNGTYKLEAGLGKINITLTIKDASGHEVPYADRYKNLTINANHAWSAWTSNGNGTHTRICGNGCVASPQTEYCADTSPADCKCDDCGASMHNWQFKAAGNKLTGTCGGANCDIKEIVLTLKADSVTLPNSPFNARLEGWEQFQDAIPTAYYEKLVYKYNGPSGWTEVEPIAANAKAGEYQVGVRILGLPDKENGPVAMSLDDEVIPDGAGYADLFVQYTAADPAVTAQTGDNRPIELMMAGILVFSALAAAAFIVDSKRKNASL